MILGGHHQRTARMKFERAHRIISYCVVTIADEFYSLGAAMHMALELI